MPLSFRVDLLKVAFDRGHLGFDARVVLEDFGNVDDRDAVAGGRGTLGGGIIGGADEGGQSQNGGQCEGRET